VEAVNQLNPRFSGERTLVRFELEKDTTEFPALTKGIILATASVLDMHRYETPLVGEHDLIVPLGAARMENANRPAYAAKAVATGQASGRIVMAGSVRPLNPGEAEAAASYAYDNPQTEADLVIAGAARAAEAYDVDIATVISDNPRAGTPDVTKLVIEQMGLQPGMRMAGVITQIYRTSADLDVARVGGAYGIDTAVAGNPSNPETVAKRTVATYHSEILRTLRAAANTYRGPLNG
jgi:hypothetical protein